MSERKPPTNPFYRTTQYAPAQYAAQATPPTQPSRPPAQPSGPSQSSIHAGAPPPAYSRPTPAPPSNQPVSYGSLSDLQKGRRDPSLQPGSSGYQYTPDPTRQGYRNDHASESAGPGRRMPPPPSNHGVEIPREPPRRTPSTNSAAANSSTSATAAGATAPTFQSRLATAQTTVGGYIPNSVSATATSLGDRVRGGYDSLTTQQRREQVVSGAGKAAAGAAKLAGKAAWQLGKFASNTK